MNLPDTIEPKLDDVLCFNEQLLLLDQVGVPMELGYVADPESLSERLHEINSRIAIHVARGRSVKQFLETDHELPPLYQSSLATWLYCDKSPEAFAAMSESANRRRDIEKVFEYAFIQPLILLGLVYCGFIYFVLAIVPNFEAIYAQINSTPGYASSWLTEARRTLWIWATAVPLIVVLSGLLGIQRRKKLRLRWLSEPKTVGEALQSSSYSTALANFLEHDYSVEQGAKLVGTFKDEKRSVAKGGNTDSTHVALPPLLFWALSGDVSDDERASALRFSARVYRELAQSRASRLRTWVPIIVGTGLGGAVVLIFGMSLFSPMIELLITLTEK